MVHLKLILDKEDGAFKELAGDRPMIEIDSMTIATLTGGMVSGKGSVAMGFVLPTGEFVFAQTSVMLFLQAAKAIAIKHPAEAEEIGI